MRAFCAAMSSATAAGTLCAGGRRADSHSPAFFCTSFTFFISGKCARVSAWECGCYCVCVRACAVLYIERARGVATFSAFWSSAASVPASLCARDCTSRCHFDTGATPCAASPRNGVRGLGTSPLIRPPYSCACTMYCARALRERWGAWSRLLSLQDRAAFFYHLSGCGPRSLRADRSSRCKSKHRPSSRGLSAPSVFVCSVLTHMAPQCGFPAGAESAHAGAGPMGHALTLLS